MLARRPPGGADDWSLDPGGARRSKDVACLAAGQALRAHHWSRRGSDVRRLAGAVALAASLGCVASEESGVHPIVGCLDDSDCLYGYYCQGGGCQQSPRTCASDADCLIGESCQANLAPGCIHPDSGLDCSAPTLCQPTDLGYCCPCQTDAQCAPGGYCLILGSGNACSVRCSPRGCTSADCCPSGSSCGSIRGPDGGLLETCLPNGRACLINALNCR